MKQTEEDQKKIMDRVNELVREHEREKQRQAVIAKQQQESFNKS